MAEPLKSTPDFPNFDTYPGRAVGSEHLLPKQASPGAIGEWPERSLPRSSQAMNGAAEKVGEAVGAAVSKARELPRHLNTLKSKLTLIKGKSGAQASETAEEWKRTADAKVSEARNRAQHYANEYPLQVIAAAAGVAFLLGLALRIWRGHRG
jgi:ElaB/YqjD/DUF883 family membrane-anchored ribosome-binding protein